MKVMKSAGIKVVPHLCIGFGEELYCIELLKKELSPEIIVFIGFRQTKGTELESFAEPSLENWKETIAYAKKLFPATELALGCMRSRKNKEKIELEALQAGASRIVLPARKILEFALRNNYRIEDFESCCAMPENLKTQQLTTMENMFLP
jgi:uncharacterized radical SAM superfamily protein